MSDIKFIVLLGLGDPIGGMALVELVHQARVNHALLKPWVDAVNTGFRKVQPQAHHFFEDVFAHTAKVRDVAPFFYSRFALH